MRNCCNNKKDGIYLMNKGEFLKAMAEIGDYSGKEAAQAYDAFVGAVTEALRKGEKIQLSGFGTYEVKNRKAREAFNPLTKAKVHVPASKAPNFKFGASFKSLLD